MATIQKVRVPDGRGGWTDVDGEVQKGHQASADKQEEALKNQFYAEAGELTERLLQFDDMYLRDKGLTKEHRVFAASLYCVNLREGYPDGPAAFDAIASAAAAYYDANDPKKSKRH